MAAIGFTRILVEVFGCLGYPVTLTIWLMLPESLKPVWQRMMATVEKAIYDKSALSYDKDG